MAALSAAHVSLAPRGALARRPRRAPARFVVRAASPTNPANAWGAPRVVRDPASPPGASSPPPAAASLPSPGASGAPRRDRARLATRTRSGANAGSSGAGAESSESEWEEGWRAARRHPRGRGVSRVVDRNGANGAMAPAEPAEVFAAVNAEGLGVASAVPKNPGAAGAATRSAAAAAHSTPARMISAAGEGKNGSPATPELDAGEPTDAGDASDAASPGPWSTRPGSKRAWIRANGEKVWRALTAADAAEAPDAGGFPNGGASEPLAADTPSERDMEGYPAVEGGVFADEDPEPMGADADAPLGSGSSEGPAYAREEGSSAGLSPGEGRSGSRNGEESAKDTSSSSAGAGSASASGSGSNSPKKKDKRRRNAVASPPKPYGVMRIDAPMAGDPNPPRRFEQQLTRRALLRDADLTPRDLRRIDPSLLQTNNTPALLVKDRTIMVNLGVRVIIRPDHALLFEPDTGSAQRFLAAVNSRHEAEAATDSFPAGTHKPAGGKDAHDAAVASTALDDDLDATPGGAGGTPIPFELEMVEAALQETMSQLYAKLEFCEQRCRSVSAQLRSSINPAVLEELRLSKQSLVALDSRAGAVRQVLLDTLDDDDDIADFTISSEATDPEEKEDEEEEVENLIEYYLQQTETVHNAAEQLLENTRDLEESISVSLSSRRYEVSKLELTLSIATFAAALGALVTGIFGMNLRSCLEMSVTAFYLTCALIVAGIGGIFSAIMRFARRQKIL